MSREKKYRPEEIIPKLREAEADASSGEPGPVVNESFGALATLFADVGRRRARLSSH